MVVAVRVTQPHGYQVQMTVTDPRLRNHRLGEGLDLVGTPAQDRGFYAMVVVQSSNALP